MKLFSLLSPGSLHLQSDKKFIPAAEFNQLLEAKQILEKALEDAEKLKKDTELECENCKIQAREEGLQNGLEEFNKHILSLDSEAKKIYLSMQKVVLSLALKAAQKIVNKELETHPDTIVDIVIQAIYPAKQNKRVSIFVNREDREALEKSKPKLKDLFEQVQVLSIQERPGITPGGCIIETESGIINATIENQWKALELAFERYKQ